MKVLVTTDGSDNALKAVKRALDLAEKEDAKVTIMSVALYPSSEFDDLPLSIQKKLDADAKDAIAKAKTIFDKKGIAVDTALETGIVPANNIIRKAKEGKFDLVLMGSTGATGLTKVLMGSTASKVVTHAPCSVSVVR
jgi:nucleotide-binding universal stress UspA family protein